jgi:hypothetical protein
MATSITDCSRIVSNSASFTHPQFGRIRKGRKFDARVTPNGPGTFSYLIRCEVIGVEKIGRGCSVSVKVLESTNQQTWKSNELRGQQYVLSPSVHFSK